MYIPPSFSQESAAALDLITREPFGLLVSMAQGEVLLTHLPWCVAQTEPTIRLCGHFAKANPHWRNLDGAAVVVAFTGAHGYISPRWYAEPRRDVPTWNYEVVHCSGTARIAPRSDTPAILSRLVDAMEKQAPQPWSIHTLDPHYFEELQEGIVAVYIDVHTVEGKSKLSQNRSATDRDGAIAGLRKSLRPQDHQLADAMECTLQQAKK